jgi:2-polyprenyl-6-hydroxyphenyl methylase/3-demethylubiquinone-9 3-methyltransferase
MAPLFGCVDFNKNCEEPNGVCLPPSGILVPYHRCGNCGFLFTRFFDHWTHEEFQAHVYNKDYSQVDPEFQTKRPAGWAENLAMLFHEFLPQISVLDWGGGTGCLAEHLRVKGVREAVTWDPFNPDFQTLPEGVFNLVTCIEVLEHLPDPGAGIRSLARFLPTEGAILLSTLLQPENIVELGTSWWYLAPRNGHISFFTPQGLEALFAGCGLHFMVFKPHVHWAWREVPFFFRMDAEVETRVPALAT